MFRKIISNLPFNPSMIHQVSFYAKRLKKEQAVRKVGSIFMALALLVQSFAFLAPASASTQCADNNLIHCGVTSKDALIQNFDANVGGLQSIYAAFNVGRNELLNVNVSSDVVSSPSNNYYSVGRHASGADVQTFKDPSSSNYFYFRKLYTATNNRVIPFEAFTGTSASGQQFWILMDCGNITVKGKDITPVSTPVPPTPVTPIAPTPTTTISTPQPATYPLSVDVGNCDVFAGWTYDTSSSDTSLRVDIYFYNPTHTGAPINGVSGPTNIVRNDINTAYGIAGAHGYSIQTPDSLKNGSSYSVDVITIGTDGLAKNSKTISIGPCGSPVTTTVTVLCTSGPLAGLPAPNNSAASCPAPSTPKLEIIKDNITKGVVKPGSQIIYRIQYRNTGPAIADSAHITDSLPANVTYVSTSQTSGLTVNGQIIDWSLGSLAVTTNYSYVDITVKVKDSITSGTNICNTSRITANGYDVSSNEVCNMVEVIEDCPYKPGQGIPKTDKTRCQECQYTPTISFDDPKCVAPPTPTAFCQYLRLISSSTPNIVSLVREFEAATDVSGSAKITAYWYDFDGDGIYDVKHDANKNEPLKDRANFEYKKPGTYTAKLLVKTSLGDKTDDQCMQVVTINETPKPVILNLSKRVKNITQGLEDGTTKEAQAGDILEYSLVTSNAGGTLSKATNLDVENLGDVLLYADITDIGDAEYTDTSKATLRWAPVDIEPGQTITKLVRVKVKNPLPSTPLSPGDQTGFDNVLTNKYGNVVINVKLPKSIVKRVESINTTLPNTGPGTSLFFGFVTTVIVGYFFARTKLLSRELDIIKQEYTVGAY